ncbi:hypothetical protein C3K47_06790 [Solitalea longa]|uniref:PKD domain-containing protein n=1 Tax=Solitalea longa TaxID=2079460 RepID=A0A2S5A5T6_9SPHI|nr:hypothetical protein [Solitalea longa]POY37463.1 hypothetical protein C3K47_06790 [Solitalea longa]
MKHLKKFIWVVLIGISFITSCQKETYELGRLLDKSEIKFEVVQDLVADPGGNTVILINKTPGTIAKWDYGTGKSMKDRDTIRYAFKGDYTVNLSFATDGGIVEADPVTVKVTADNLNYVSDPLWIALSGGPGNEKSWVLDVTAKYFAGPLFFAGTNNEWPYTKETESFGCGGSDCWNWNPQNDPSWLVPSGDYGTMTFSLKGGPFVKTNHLMLSGRGQESGTYYLDKDKKTLTMTGATPLHDTFRDGCVGEWGKIRVMSLTENTMQLAVLRTSCEGPCLLIYNFISKEYSDNWVPPAPPAGDDFDEGFNPALSSNELVDMLTGTSTRTWGLDVNGNPVDWVAKGKGWTAGQGDSRDWGWNDSWVAAATNSWIKFEKTGLKYTRSQNGTLTSGTFSVDASTNEINLGSNTLIQNAGHWMNPTQTTIKVIKAFKGEEATKGIWLGTAYDSTKDEWLVFHYITQ